MKFTDETKLELGKYKITCDDGMMYQLTVDTDMYPTDLRETSEQCSASLIIVATAIATATPMRKNRPQHFVASTERATKKSTR